MVIVEPNSDANHKIMHNVFEFDYKPFGLLPNHTTVINKVVKQVCPAEEVTFYVLDPVATSLLGITEPCQKGVSSLIYDNIIGAIRASARPGHNCQSFQNLVNMPNFTQYIK